MEQAISVQFEPSGRGKARCPANPDFPNGIAVNAALEDELSCKADLPYPAPECGVFIVRCSTCGMSIGVTAAGRPDDPISVKIPCKTRATVN